MTSGRDPTPRADGRDGVADTVIAPGSHAGDYVVIDEIARGGFGAVWRAERTGEAGQFALKVLHAELASSAEAVARFQREASAIKAIRHPNVVELFDIGVLPDGRPFFSMELLPGVGLEQRLHERGALAPSEALAVLQPVCDALHAAHAQKIIHRDVKASNVMLSERDGQSRVVLLDFGLAKILEDGGPALTASRCALGTPSCIAPEQVRGEPVDRRSDVYALGALLFQLLTGETPFAQHTNATLYYMHLYSRRPRPSSRVDVSAAVDDVVLRAMARDRSGRYASAIEVAEAFRAALHDSRSQREAALEEDAGPTRTIGLYVDVGAEQSALDDPDDGLLDDMESVVPLAARRLQGGGFVLTHQRGNSALFVRSIAASSERAGRRSAVNASVDLSCELADRPRRDLRVRVRLCLHISDESDPVASLLCWATDLPIQGAEGVFGSRDVFDGLGLETQPTSGAVELHTLCAQ